MLHPLRVHFRHSGTFYLLRWHSHNEGHHIILAPSEKSLRQAFKSVVNKYDVSIKDAFKIEMASPPEGQVKEAGEVFYKYYAKLFTQEIAHRLIEFKDLEKLPPMFEVCSNYERDYEDNEAASDASKWAKENHYSCKNCMDGHRLIGLSPEQLFDKYAQRWYKKEDYYNPFIDSKTFPSSAASCEVEQLWMARGNFGHHSEGVVLEKFNPEFYQERVLFYFKKLEDLDISLLDKQLKEDMEAQAAKKLFNSKSFKHRVETEKLNRILEVMSIFEET